MIILNGIMVLILVVLFLYCYMNFYKGVLIKRTDKAIDRYFLTTNIWKDMYHVNTDNLAVELGSRIFAVKQLKLWQIKGITKIFDDNDFDIDKIILSNDFLVALAIIFSKKDDIQGSYKLGYYFGECATTEQLNRAIRVIIIKNNFLSLLLGVKNFIKEQKVV